MGFNFVADKFSKTKCNKQEMHMKRSEKFRYRARGAVGGVLLWIAGTVGAGCARTVYVPVESDSVRHDSLSAVSRLSDMSGVSDSVVIFVKGDTVVRDRVRTLWRERVVADTVYSVRSDTVRVEIPVVRSGVVSEESRKRKSGMAWWGVGVLCVLCGVAGWRIRKIVA